ncbi:type VI secretion system-associated protein TagF [Rhodovulum sp. DZ06]|uniref:type VI secretion system-associated protein TagF n=1 Tax=Rhodovulum sp. DZ06 TaxID=3425126 RepID=UPI003D34E954
MTGRGLLGRLFGGGDAPAGGRKAHGAAQGGEAARARGKAPGVALAHVGYCGKAPSAGDFIARGLPPAERERLERFLADGLKEAQAAPGFDEGWAVMPVWRFAARPGALCERLAVGVVCPSVDRVGRRFPLCLLALGEAGEDADPDALLVAAAPFLASAEAAAIRALDAGFPPEAAFAEVMAVRRLPAPNPVQAGGAASVWETGGGRYGAAARVPAMGAPSARAVAAAMIASGRDVAAGRDAALAAEAAEAPPEPPAPPVEEGGAARPETAPVETAPGARDAAPTDGAAASTAQAPSPPPDGPPLFADAPAAADDAPLFPEPAAPPQDAPLFPEAPLGAPEEPPLFHRGPAAEAAPPLFPGLDAAPPREDAAADAAPDAASAADPQKEGRP